MDTRITDMTPRQLIVGLMRGDRASLKAGYSAKAATLTAIEINNIAKDSPSHLKLLAFAEGFAYGMHEDNSVNNPATIAEDLLERTPTS
jgi:hypothetical protein